MAMGRQKDGQGDLMVSWSEMPPRARVMCFMTSLQSVLIEGGFDAFAEVSCRPYYAVRMGETQSVLESFLPLRFRSRQRQVLGRGCLDPAFPGQALKGERSISR